MKLIRHLLDKVRPNFETERKLHLLRPLFHAIDNFLLSPATATAAAPFIRDPLDVKRFMSAVILALMPSVLASLYFFGLRVIAMIAVSYAVGGTIEVLIAIARKEEINEGFLVTGLIFPLVLPPSLPMWMVAVGIAFGVIVGKELFGGTGRNLFNPALVGRCFLAIGYPVAMSSQWIKPGAGLVGRLTQYVTSSNVDAVSKATPLVSAKQGTYAPVIHLLLGNVSGSVGETSALAVLAGGIFLLAAKVANWRAVAGTVGTFLVLGVILHQLHPGRFGPVGWHLLAGGLLFGAFFMATDPITSPLTNSGKWLYGGLIGTATLLIRNLTGYVEGIMFAILLGNIVAPLLDEAAVRFRLGRLRGER